MFDKKNKIMRDFINNTKRIRIDYKNIKDYKDPFVMTLKIKGKRKLDVWAVQNGQEAETIREEYKRKNRYTSYVDFYKNIDDLLEEKDAEALQLHPRIRGRNVKEKAVPFGTSKEDSLESDAIKVDLGELYEFMLCVFKTHEKIEEYIKELVKEDFEKLVKKVANELLSDINNL